MALNLALKLVVLHVELENVKHGVLHDALVEVSETQILFHWIGLKKLAFNQVNYNIVHSAPHPQPILDKNSPTGIGLKKAGQIQSKKSSV